MGVVPVVTGGPVISREHSRSTPSFASDHCARAAVGPML